MKKIIVTLIAAAFALGVANAQDLAAVTELYNNGATALSTGDKAGALSIFESVIPQAEALGEEGAEIVANCKNVIPSIYLSIAKDLVGASDYDAAIAKLNEAIEVAGKYEAAAVADEAKGIIPQVLMQKAGTLLNAKDYAGAAAAYKTIVDADPTNGVAALRLGMALNGKGDLAEAKAAFEVAAANGQEATAKKQIANICLKEAAAALKAKKYADAVAAAVASFENNSSAQAYRIAGQASQLAGKNADAIKYYEQMLELFPKDKNAGSIAYTVGALYQTAKNNAKAKEYYKLALTDPKYGAEAQKMLDALK